jgi:hypothetical protein
MTTRRRKADTNGQLGSMLYTAARNNPEGLLLLAAGAALLVRKALPQSPRGNERRGPGATQEDDGERWVDTAPISEAMDGARQYAADLGAQVSDATATYASAATRYASDMGHTVAARSEQIYEDTASSLGETTERIVRDQPVLVALAGLAAGAVLATAFPRTEFEESTLGPYGERAREFASGKAQEFKDAGIEAGQRLRQSAEERGLTPDGVADAARDMARDAADAFTGALDNGAHAGGASDASDKNGRPE